MTDVFFSAIKFGEMDFLRHYFFTQIRRKVHSMFTYSTLIHSHLEYLLKGTICFYHFKIRLLRKLPQVYYTFR